MSDNRIKCYVAHRMAGRYCDELVQEAIMTTRTLENYGFEVLDPIIAEKVPNVHETLGVTDEETLARHWSRDKRLIREADVLLDYKSENRSDGVGKELAYARFCLWKPVVRIFPNLGLCISRLEDDVIVDSLGEAVQLMVTLYGDYEKLKKWRQMMWERSFANWLQEQFKMNHRYGIQFKAEVV